MYRYITILVIFIATLISNETFAQQRGDTLIYYWKEWRSTTMPVTPKETCGTLIIVRDKSVTTYVYDFGYIDWLIKKHDDDEYYLYRKEGDSCYMRIFGNKILMLYSFVHENITLEDRVSLSYNRLIER
ncbi:MAG: hypothetical protein HC836_41805 [Richelia sp. RM2_1_2]|nr:hypothetical protein [Richelia sp. RM2_1_2]